MRFYCTRECKDSCPEHTRLEAERDALKARVGKLEKGLKDILPAKDGTHYTASEMILVARAALAEDRGKSNA